MTGNGVVARSQRWAFGLITSAKGKHLSDTLTAAIGLFFFVPRTVHTKRFEGIHESSHRDQIFGRYLRPHFFDIRWKLSSPFFARISPFVCAAFICYFFTNKEILSEITLSAFNNCLPLLLDVSPMFPQEFEKDDDSNGHIDFITSASVSYSWTLSIC